MIGIAILAAGALVGHGLVWLLLATYGWDGATRSTRRIRSVLAIAGFVGFPAWGAFWLSRQELNGWPKLPAFAWFYLGICWLVSLAAAQGFFGRPRRGRSRVLCSLRTERFEVNRCAPARTGLASILPRRRGRQLEINKLEIAPPRLPPALDGLRIAHLSDLHVAGRVGRAYFSAIVEHVNQMRPDLVAITGDLIDDARYLSWLPATLGQLSARHGAFYVLGNHDLRVDLGRLRLTLAEAGLTDLGGACRRIAIGKQSVLLAGNELPWIVPAADMTTDEARQPAHLRVLLAHSPDQLGWARHFGFDLMLAGHARAGSPRTSFWRGPLEGHVGAMEFAAGVAFAPPTILHMSRGVSTAPWGWRDRPEASLLVLRAKAPTAAGALEASPPSQVVETA